MPHTDSAQNMVNFGTLSNFIFGFVFLIKNVGSIDTPLDCNRYAASIINIEISLGGLWGIISVLSLVLLTRLDNLDTNPMQLSSCQAFVTFKFSLFVISHSEGFLNANLLQVQ
jgi:hypothetical protein